MVSYVHVSVQVSVLENQMYKLIFSKPIVYRLF